jgi:hypothetical protein
MNAEARERLPGDGCPVVDAPLAAPQPQEAHKSVVRHAQFIHYGVLRRGSANQPSFTIG